MDKAKAWDELDSRLFNGFVTTYGRIPAFIVTLGTLNIARGLALVITEAFPVVIEGVGLPDSTVGSYLTLGRPMLFDVIPIQLIYFIIIIYRKLLITQK